MLTETVAIKVIGINEAPELTGKKAVLNQGNEDEIYTLNTADLLEGFTDRDGDPLSVTDLQANNGTSPTTKTAPIPSLPQPISMVWCRSVTTSTTMALSYSVPMNSPLTR